MLIKLWKWAKRILGRGVEDENSCIYDKQQTNRCTVNDFGTVSFFFLSYKFNYERQKKLNCP